MTTPRDDIAGMIERLKSRAAGTGYGGGDPLCAEAATQLDSLLKERDALESRVKELEADHALLTDPIAVHINMCRGTIAKPSWENLRHLFPIIYDLEHADRRRIKAEARATRLQQERDEAAELIRPLAILAEDSAALLSNHNSNLAPEMSSLAAHARSFVRRLASGPEKEKK